MDKALFYVVTKLPLLERYKFPKPTGTLISVLAANPRIAGTFYAANNRGIFCSTDSGSSWKMLDGVQWPKEYLSQHPWDLAVIEDA
jgi:hypothetical protein